MTRFFFSDSDAWYEYIYRIQLKCKVFFLFSKTSSFSIDSSTSLFIERDELITYPSLIQAPGIKEVQALNTSLMWGNETVMMKGDMFHMTLHTASSLAVLREGARRKVMQVFPHVLGGPTNPKNKRLI